MPSIHSVNRPKDKQIRSKHAYSLGRKRAARSSLPAQTIKIDGVSDSNTKPGNLKSPALALYSGNASSTTAVTRQKLSKKRAKKIARNQKYSEKNKQERESDVTKPREDVMDIEDDSVSTEQQKRNESRLQRIKAIFWTALRAKANESQEESIQGEGTTLGVAAF